MCMVRPESRGRPGPTGKSCGSLRRATCDTTTSLPTESHHPARPPTSCVYTPLVRQYLRNPCARPRQSQKPASQRRHLSPAPCGQNPSPIRQLLQVLWACWQVCGCGVVRCGTTAYVLENRRKRCRIAIAANPLLVSTRDIAARAGVLARRRHHHGKSQIVYKRSLFDTACELSFITPLNVVQAAFLRRKQFVNQTRESRLAPTGAQTKRSQSWILLHLSSYLLFADGASNK